jgi:exodeoxyribonuclease X
MNCIIFDTELTDRKGGEIIEAAWITLAPGPDLLGISDDIPPGLPIQSEYCERFKPSQPIAFGAMAVHHILPHELDDCPPSSAFRLPLCAFMVGHSIDFDWEAAGSPSHIRRIDTHAMSQWIWPDATGYSQSALIYMLEGASAETRAMVKQAHGVLPDVHLNHGLLCHILKQKPEIRTWSDLWLYSEQCRVPRTCPLKRWEGVLLEDMDDGAIEWCLNQSWLDPYFRIGLERVADSRNDLDRASGDRW